MASPVKETPTLTGEDAKIFIAEKKKNEGKKIDAATKKRMLENFQKLNSIAKF